MDISSDKKKLLFVIPRYGLDVHGGAEVHCRQIAERLVNDYEVEVATTTALDYISWKNHYRSGVEMVNGVKVRRFKVSKGRARNHGYLETLYRTDTANPETGSDWILGQGPTSKDMNDFLFTHHHEYHKVIVFQYLYTTAFQAVQMIPTDKLVLVPLVHDEPPAYYPVFREVFRKPNWIIYNTDIEMNLAKRIHLVQDKKSVVAGVGVETPENFSVEDFKKKFNLDKYIIFVGRLSGGKRVHILIDDFIQYKKEYPDSDLKLVLIGKRVMKLKTHKDIIETGFVTDEEKYAGIAGSIALVNPSAFESLSLIVLESFLVKRPVLVNAYCDVLKDHSEKSNGGLWYTDPLEFNETINYLLNNPEKSDQMGLNGYEYVIRRYTWDKVMEKWLKILNDV